MIKKTVLVAICVCLVGGAFADNTANTKAGQEAGRGARYYPQPPSGVGIQDPANAILLPTAAAIEILDNSVNTKGAKKATKVTQSPKKKAENGFTLE